MKVHLFKAEQFIPASLQKVFPFFAKPENLARITPPSLGFQILTPSPIQMKAGALIDYTVKVLGVRVRWTTLIADYDPPYRFTDVQLKGPYSFWHHTHIFNEVPGGVQMIDEVRYVVPFGILGDVIEPFLVRPDIRKIFECRRKVIEESFPAHE